MSSDLATVARLQVSRLVVDQTWLALRAFGTEACEGFVLWLGHLDHGRAIVTEALVPTQDSIRGEDGVGYFVNSQTLFEINRALHRTGLRLIAQVHSHPTVAYHSAMDDAYAVVTAEGGYSIVVPDFAKREPDPMTCAIHRLRASRWTKLAAGEVSEGVVWGAP